MLIIHLRITAAKVYDSVEDAFKPLLGKGVCSVAELPVHLFGPSPLDTVGNIYRQVTTIVLELILYEWPTDRYNTLAMDLPSVVSSVIVTIYSFLASHSGSIIGAMFRDFSVNATTR